MMLENKDNENKIGANIEETKPIVNINKEDEDIVIEVEHQIPIAKILYNWNNENENEIDGKNQIKISEKITLPYGTNTLNLTIIDINQNQTQFQKEYIVEEEKPIIELKLTQDNKIKISVQDKEDLQYITYSWNNEEEKKVKVNKDNPKLIEETIEIPAGQNTLKVQALNVSDISATKELEVKGIKKPKVTLTKEGSYLVIRAEDEVGMKIINYTLAGQRYQINYGNRTLIEYKQLLPEGESLLELTAENQDGGITTINAKCIN